MRVVLLWILAPALPGFAAVEDPVTTAARYYDSRHLFKQSLPLWERVLENSPGNIAAAQRVAELRLLLRGRTDARTVLVGFLRDQAQRLSKADRKRLENKLAEVLRAFLTDEGQSLFLQASLRVNRGDCAGALPLLERSLLLEDDNLEVLRLKALCQRRGTQAAYLVDTLRRAHLANPFDAGLVENLAEAYVHDGRFAEALELLRRDFAAEASLRSESLRAVALVETGKTDEAIPLLRRLLRKADAGTLPVLHFSLGKALAGTGAQREAAASHLQAFLSLVSREKVSSTWDPFRASDRTSEARQLLTKITPTL